MVIMLTWMTQRMNGTMVLHQQGIKDMLIVKDTNLIDAHSRHHEVMVRVLESKAAINIQEMTGMTERTLHSQTEG